MPQPSSLLLLAFLLASAGTPGALAAHPPGATIMTAIDAAELQRAGKSDSEVAEIVSHKANAGGGAVRAGAHDDLGALVRLLQDPPAVTEMQPARAVQCEAEGTALQRSGDYRGAARKFTEGMAHAAKKTDLYRLRGDAYRLYVKTEVLPAFSRYSSAAIRSSLARSKKLVCDAAIADYAMAEQLSRKERVDGRSDLNYLKSEMSKKGMQNDPSLEVDPYYNRSAQKIVEMRKMTRLQQSQRRAVQAEADVTRGLGEAKMLCR